MYHCSQVSTAILQTFTCNMSPCSVNMNIMCHLQLKLWVVTPSCAAPTRRWLSCWSRWPPWGRTPGRVTSPSLQALPPTALLLQSEPLWRLLLLLVPPRLLRPGGLSVPPLACIMCQGLGQQCLVSLGYTGCTVLSWLPVVVQTSVAKVRTIIAVCVTGRA